MRRTISLFVVCALVLVFSCGCGETAKNSGASKEKSTVRVGVIKGPSGLGMLGLMEKNADGTAQNSYEFTLAGAPADIQSRIINGELDIAAIPTNIASVLYNKTNKDVSVISVSTLGVLYLVTNGEVISSFSDLDGHAIYASAPGATPEYILDYLIKKNGLSVLVEYKTEHAELAAMVASGDAGIAMLPQPFVTTVTMKNPDIKIALDLNDEWRKATGGKELTMTCIIVRNDFLKENEAAVKAFLAEYEESTKFVNDNVDEAAVLSEKFDIIPEAVAKVAIPKCGIVYISGGDIKKSVEPLLSVLLEANPQSIGGVLPDDAFYYKG